MHLDEMFLCQNVLNLESKKNKKNEDAVQHYNKGFMKPTLKRISQFDITKTKGYVGPIIPKTGFKSNMLAERPCNSDTPSQLQNICSIFAHHLKCQSNILISPIHATMIELFLKCRYYASSLQSYINLGINFQRKVCIFFVSYCFHKLE